jgi:hypothetical protein
MTSSTDGTPIVQPEPTVPSLSTELVECLRCVAGHMIPASTALGVPGADDELILTDLIGSIGRDWQVFVALLKSVDEAAGGSVVTLETADQAMLLARLRAQDPVGFAAVEAVIARAYYRDYRVLASIGMAARSPFPLGYDLVETDWSLLDPVRERGPLWRRVD